MEFYTSSKILSLIIFCCFKIEYVHASQQIIEEEHSVKIARICNQLKSHLLTGVSRDEMYAAYDRKELTVEDVAYKIDKSRHVSRSIKEILQKTQDVKIELIKVMLEERL